MPAGRSTVADRTGRKPTHPNDPLIAHFRAWPRATPGPTTGFTPPALPERESRAKRTSFFPSLHLTLRHILEVDWFYLDRMEGAGTERRDMDCDLAIETLVELTAAQRAMDRRLMDFCGRLTPAILEAPVALRRPDGSRPTDPASAVLAHLFVHQIHHRGRAHAMLAGTRLDPPQLDEFFQSHDAPKRAADLRALELG